MSMSNPKSIRNSHTATARELYFANIAATAATTERTMLVVWSDELRMNHQGTAWELEALQAARVAVRDALKQASARSGAQTPAAAATILPYTDFRTASNTHHAAVARTRETADAAGVGCCVACGLPMSHKIHRAAETPDAQAAPTSTPNLPTAGDAGSQDSATAATDALEPSAVLVVNSTDALRVQALATHLAAQGVPMRYDVVGACRCITVNLVDVRYVADYWTQFQAWPESTARNIIEGAKKDAELSERARPFVIVEPSSVGASVAPAPAPKSTLEPAAIEAMAAVCARVTFSNLLTREQALQVYRFTGITAEDLPRRPGEVKRVNVPAEGIVVRFSKWHTRATDGRAPLWLCEHIAPEHKA